MPESSEAPHLSDLIRSQLSRRAVLGGAAALLSLPGCATRGTDVGIGPRQPGFMPVAPNRDDRVTVPPGYRAHLLVSWGDPLFETAEGPFDPDRLTRADQELRFGTNNDMLALFPARYRFPEPRDADHMILCANNEHFERALMYPALSDRNAFGPSQVEAMYAALGVSVVELRRSRGQWRAVRNARPGAGFNRRITPFTPVTFGGPAAGHRWIASAAVRVAQTEPSPPGTIACGTMVNCAGGKTPWGTYLTCEEGFPFYFSCSDENAHPLADARNDPAYAADGRSYSYPLAPDRRQPLAPPQFDLARNPMGPSLYGWVVEIDPYAPDRAPAKRTALGRRWNEGATTALTRDGRVAVYMGDDTPNQFVYKFITRDRFDPADRAANLDLLDEGTLYVARYDADGGGEWLAMTMASVSAAAAAAGYAPPFADLGDIMMRTREAARLLGATPMDRPEDIEPLLDAEWRGLGPVLINCTGNPTVKPPTPANPRRSADEPQPNIAGHILRIDEAGEDSGALRFRWDVFALCGDPHATEPTRTLRNGRVVHLSTEYGGRQTFTGSAFSSPDNICFDSRRNAWITTNGMPTIFGRNDGVMVVPLDKTAPRTSRCFLTGPLGCEICGPTFSFDERAFFVAIQHPGDSDGEGIGYPDRRWSGAAQRPPSSWPRGGDAWPLPSVVYVVKDDGGIVGT